MAAGAAAGAATRRAIDVRESAAQASVGAGLARLSSISMYLSVWLVCSSLNVTGNNLPHNTVSLTLFNSF